MKRFTIRVDDKRLVIVGDLDMEIFIDYDDVSHKDVMRKAKQLCQMLEDHWQV